MKHMLLFGMLWLLSFGTVAGEYDENYEKTPEYRSVEMFEGSFEVKLDEETSTLHTSWDSFDGEWFLWYKLLYSTTQSQPVYPDQSAIFVGTDISQNSNSFDLKYGKNHYLRLCVVTSEENYQKWRYCSEVKKIQASVSTNKTEQKYTKKISPVKKTTQAISLKKDTQIKKVQLNEQTTQKLEAVLSSFFQKLEDEWYSDEQKNMIIDRAVTRLDELKQKKPRYEAIVAYMKSSLETYQSNLNNDIWDIESIFEDF